MLGAIASWVTSVVATLGYPGLFVLLLLENVFPPLPSELILPLAGFLTGQGQMQFHWAVLAATAGSLAGAYVLYGLGAVLGEERLRGLIRDHGRWLLLCEADLDKAEGWFDRHGAEAVLFARVLPVVRSLVSVPAGLRRMPLWKFTVYTVIGTSVFDGALIGLGWWLGSRWELVEQYASWLEYGGLALLAGFVGWFVWKRLRNGSNVCEQQSGEQRGRDGAGTDGRRFERPADQPEAQWADDVRVATSDRGRR